MCSPKTINQQPAIVTLTPRLTEYLITSTPQFIIVTLMAILLDLKHLKHLKHLLRLKHLIHLKHLTQLIQLIHFKHRIIILLIMAYQLQYGLLMSSGQLYFNRYYHPVFTDQSAMMIPL